MLRQPPRSPRPDTLFPDTTLLRSAQIMSLFPLMAPGRNVVVSTRLYGGSITQFSQTIKRFGWSATFVDFDDTDAVAAACDDDTRARSEEHTSELQSLMRISYAVFCLKKKTKQIHTPTNTERK